MSDKCEWCGDYKSLCACADYEALRVKNERLRAAGTALYMAGKWSCDIPADEQAHLWEAMRDAIGLPAGTETARAAVQPSAIRPGDRFRLPYAGDSDLIVTALRPATVSGHWYVADSSGRESLVQLVSCERVDSQPSTARRNWAGHRQMHSSNPEGICDHCGHKIDAHLTGDYYCPRATDKPVTAQQEQWTRCVFAGPPPKEYANWQEFWNARVKQDVYVRAVRPGDFTQHTE
jgi:hypothetical protein